MADGISNLVVELISRMAPKRGPTSSEAYNDLQNETIATLTGIANQWNNQLVSLLSGLPNGTNDLNPWAIGLDGTGIYTDMSASSSNVNQTYWNSAEDRPNSIREQFDNVYTQFIVLSDQLQVDIATAIANLSTGGGSDLTAGNGIEISSNAISVDQTYGFSWSGTNTWSGSSTFTAGISTTQITNPPTSLSSGAGTKNINWSTSAIQALSISGSVTLTFSGAVSGQVLLIAIASSGSYSVTWPTIKWLGGNIPTMTASGTDIYTITYIAGTYYGQAGQAYA